jgi:hypothetical protein
MMIEPNIGLAEIIVLLLALLLATGVLFVIT